MGKNVNGVIENVQDSLAVICQWYYIKKCPSN